jgi:small subunit ribosomal protein S20
LANHKSAVKRDLQNQKRRLRNRAVKTRMKGVIKKLDLLIKEGDANATSEELKTVQSVIDTAAKKGVVHSKTAARKISRLTRRAG